MPTLRISPPTKTDKSSRLAGAAIAVALVLLSPWPAAANGAEPLASDEAAFEAQLALMGPLGLRHTHPLLTAYRQGRIASLTTREGLSTRFLAEGSNVFMFDPGVINDELAVLVDTETYLATLELEWGFSLFDRLHSIHLSTHWLGQYGGVADGFLDAYHRILGVPNAGRELLPKNRSLLRIIDQGEILVWESGNEHALTRVDAEIRSSIARAAVGASARFRIGANAALSVPLVQGPLLLSSGTVDAEAGILAQLENDPWEVYTNIGMILTGPVSTYGEAQFDRTLFRYGLAFAYRVWGPLSVHVQMQGTESPSPVSHPRLSGLMSIAGFGLGLSFASGWEARVALTEEFFTFAATDVSVFLGIRRRFGEYQ